MKRFGALACLSSANSCKGEAFQRSEICLLMRHGDMPRPQISLKHQACKGSSSRFGICAPPQLPIPGDTSLPSCNISGWHPWLRGPQTAGNVCTMQPSVSVIRRLRHEIQPLSSNFRTAASHLPFSVQPSGRSFEQLGRLTQSSRVGPI